ncbi:HU family DNA-binding protein [Sutterella massiliensis]|uniref:HU family DNA-binding protein n=1 Tax=Sutterella massiliensis TaxID=1816689 RepID=A0ABS2DVA5_9BURK|nr:HU family DNA-binding protein [Sutterella massiliensis]MBM6704648.1 HU family DNA-binding protein [Sutterella massiliensis]
MNRLELVDRVAACNTASKAEVDRIIVSALEEIINAVRNGESVTLIGFGTFKAVDCAARTGRNPSTGEAIRIPAMKKPKFIPGTSFKELLNK